MVNLKNSLENRSKKRLKGANYTRTNRSFTGFVSRDVGVKAVFSSAYIRRR
jgi:hypothetical protein